MSMQYMGLPMNYINVCSTAGLNFTVAELRVIGNFQWGTCFVIDGAANGVTKICHDVTFPLVDVAPQKRSCTFFTGFIFKRKHCLIPASCRFFI
jgi:hypothetical protein